MFVTPGSRANRKRSPSITGGSLLPIVGNGLTVTTSTPLLDLSQTWNNAAVAFTGAKLNVTDTAQVTGSLLIDIQSGGVSRFKTNNDGQTTFSGKNAVGGPIISCRYDAAAAVFTVDNNGATHTGSMNAAVFNAGSGYGWLRANGTNWLELLGFKDTIVFSAANVSPLGGTAAPGKYNFVSGTQPQGLFVYNTADASAAPTNFERGIFDWNHTANTLTIGTESGGTGVADRRLNIMQGGNTVLSIASGSSYFSTSLQVQNGGIFNQGGIAFGGGNDLSLSRENPTILHVSDSTGTNYATVKLGRVVTGVNATVTASTPLLDLSQTWNNAAVTFTALKLNVTNTASAAGSLLLDLQVGGVSRFSLGTNRVITLDNGFTPLTLTIDQYALRLGGSAGDPSYAAPNFDTSNATATSTSFRASLNALNGSITAGACLTSGAIFGWSSNATTIYGNTIDAGISRNAAGILQVLRPSALTSAAGIQVYNTTDALTGAPTNYERGIFDWTTTANTLTVGAQAGGTGTLRSINIVGNGISMLPGGIDAFQVRNTTILVGNGGGYQAVSINNVPFLWAPTNSYAFDVGIQRATGHVLQITNGSTSSLDGAYINWGGQARVTTNFTSSNATLTSITGLSSVTLNAGRSYAFSAWLAVTGSSLAGVQIGITCSSTTITTLLSDGFMHDAGVMRGSSVGVINSTGTPVVAVSSATVTSSNPSIRIDGMIRVASSGLFGLTLAQSTASATQTIVSSASYMIVYDMP